MSGIALENFDLEKYHPAVEDSEVVRVKGKIEQVLGLVIESTIPGASIGDLCHIYSGSEQVRPLHAEVVGFRSRNALLMPLGDMTGVGMQSEVVRSFRPLTVRVGSHLLGRVLNALGEPIDGKGPIRSETEYPLLNTPSDPLARPRITRPLPTGVRAIDSTLTIGEGQRIGIFSGSGVGKSMLLGMIARHTSAEVNVIALVGERGREVKDFLERDLGKEGLARAVVVAVTSDQPALLRLKGAMVATAIAEYFRDQGARVVLMMDSVTRFAMAQREVGLAIGEPPTTRGYPPSVFALLPKLLERAGTSPSGSITGFYAVLVEADDLNEPISDAVRSILDGHIVLARDLATQNHYPAVDVLQSISRVMVDVVSSDHRRLAGRFREHLANYHGAEDLINIGAYVSGSNPNIDAAIKKIGPMRTFLRQDLLEHSKYEDTLARLNDILADEEEDKSTEVAQTAENA